MTEITGERLVLRELEPDDVGPRYAAWMNDPEITRFLETKPGSHTELSLRAYVEQVRADPSSHLFAIVLREDGRHIGNIKLGPVVADHGRADIGLVIGERDSWGHGYATEAIAALSAWAFACLGLEKLTAGAYDVNVGSVRAFQRAGFLIEAVLRAHGAVDGRRVDVVLLARLADGADSTG